MWIFPLWTLHDLVWIEVWRSNLNLPMNHGRLQQSIIHWQIWMGLHTCALHITSINPRLWCCKITYQTWSLIEIKNYITSTSFQYYNFRIQIRSLRDTPQHRHLATDPSLTRPTVNVWARFAPLFLRQKPQTTSEILASNVNMENDSSKSPHNGQK